jgi:hypothetical protein
MSKQTLAPHMLLYSKDLFIRLFLRRSRFWRIIFLRSFKLFDTFWLDASMLCKVGRVYQESLESSWTTLFNASMKGQTYMRVK